MSMEIIKKRTKPYVFTLNVEPRKKVQELMKWGYSFKVSYTQRSCKIDIPELNEVYIKGGKGYTYKEFNSQRDLRKRVREAVELNKIEVPVYTAEDITYTCYSDFVSEMPVGHTIEDVIELDVNKAYYQCAYNLGYITKEMYDKYIVLPKEVRLRFIGSIATRKRIYTYDKGELNESVQIKEDLTLRNVWFHICKHIDNAMVRFKELAGDNFLMYYVDGIYLKKGDYHKELEIIKNEFNLEFKYAPVEYITKRMVKHDNSTDKLCITINKYEPSTKKFVEKDFILRLKPTIKFNIYANVLKENGY